jgi:hypothetical protein
LGHFDVAKIPQLFQSVSGHPGNSMQHERDIEGKTALAIDERKPIEIVQGHQSSERQQDV